MKILAKLKSVVNFYFVVFIFVELVPLTTLLNCKDQLIRGFQLQWTVNK